MASNCDPLRSLLDGIEPLPDPTRRKNKPQVKNVEVKNVEVKKVKECRVDDIKEEKVVKKKYVKKTWKDYDQKPLSEIKVYILKNYTEKSFVVYGDILPLTDILKDLGGIYNPNIKYNNETIKCRVFSNRKYDEVINKLTSLSVDFAINNNS